ncbi:MAG: prepilin-type N-terminal cleavage/methylation domain-containing protein [Candidatus Omnitrophota bacterium]
MLKKKISGFTLIEIMVVIGVIVILLALAIPSLLRSRINANETAAIANCRLVANACQLYYGNIIPHEYPANSGPAGLGNLISPASVPPYIDETLASGEKQGYAFIYNRVDEEMFTFRASPVREGRTGNRYFYVDETGMITNKLGESAGPTDDPVSG